MIGKIRIFLALGLVVVGSLVLVPLQILSMKTGLVARDVYPASLAQAHHQGARACASMSRAALSSQRPLLVASNHISWTDIMVLGSLPM